MTFHPKHVIIQPLRPHGRIRISPGFIRCQVCTDVNNFTVVHTGKPCRTDHPALSPRPSPEYQIWIDEMTEVTEEQLKLITEAARQKDELNRMPTLPSRRS